MLNGTNCMEALWLKLHAKETEAGRDSNDGHSLTRHVELLCSITDIWCFMTMVLHNT